MGTLDHEERSQEEITSTNNIEEKEGWSTNREYNCFRPLSKEPVSNVVPLQQQRWYDFDPHMDVHIGNFVGVQASESTQQNGELFWMAKVRELCNVAREDG